MISWRSKYSVYMTNNALETTLVPASSCLSVIHVVVEPKTAFFHRDALDGGIMQSPDGMRG